MLFTRSHVDTRESDSGETGADTGALQDVEKSAAAARRSGGQIYDAAGAEGKVVACLRGKKHVGFDQRL